MTDDVAKGLFYLVLKESSLIDEVPAAALSIAKDAVKTIWSFLPGMGKFVPNVREAIIITASGLGVLLIGFVYG